MGTCEMLREHEKPSGHHRISGALEPKAMSVKLATVSFHTYETIQHGFTKQSLHWRTERTNSRAFTVVFLPVSLFVTCFFTDVTFSMEAMNTFRISQAVPLPLFCSCPFCWLWS